MLLCCRGGSLFPFLCYRFQSMLASPFLWLSGVVFWMVESFLLLLLLQPTHALSLTQRMGLLWGLLVFSQLLLVSQFMTRQRVIAIVEMQVVSRSSRLWLYELLAFWMMYAVLFVSLSPVVCLLYGLEMSYLFILFLLWGVASPVCFLQLYLARLVCLFLRNGFFIVVLVVIPWMIPNALLVLRCLHVFASGVGLFNQLSLLLGVSMMQLGVLSIVIDRVLVCCHAHMRLAVKF